MTRLYHTDSDNHRKPERDPALYRQEEKYLHPEALFLCIDPMQVRHLRREHY